MSPQCLFGIHNWDESVLESSGTVLVDFRGPWCAQPVLTGEWYSRLMAAVGEVVLGSVDVRHDPDLAFRYKVVEFPALLWFQDGRASGACLGPDRYRCMMDLLEATRTGAASRGRP